MKSKFLLLAGILFILSACQDNLKSDDKVQSKPINISVSVVETDESSITFNISAKGVYLEDYDKWGIVYGETDDMSKGKEMTIDGTPSDKTAKFTIGGLKETAEYYIWGWAEGPDLPRVWMSYSVKAKTQKARPSSGKLTGTIIGSLYSVDYATGQKSQSVNTKENVFDGDFETYFASYDRSGTWVGLDLGEKYVINGIGYSPRITQEHRVQLAVIEGANKPDFSDAIPVHMIKDRADSRVMHHEDVSCSRGFRYVRYVSPNDVRCNLAELEFYGFKGEGDDSQLYQFTNLPTVVINTENAQEIVSKEDEISSNVYIISDGGKNILSTSDTGVRGRGNASWQYFPKKPYRLKFKSKQSPLGAPASAKKWTLISNYSDKTLMRNILAFEVSRRVGQAYTPYCHPVDLVLNGEYKGCYQLCDQVEAAEDRVPAKDGYLIEIDSYAAQETLMFWSWNGTPVTIKHPDEDDITADQKSFIEYFFNMMESSALSSDFTDPEKGYRKYLDLESFLKNFVVGEFCGNPDMLWSVYMYKDASDGKLYTGPTWDHDISFDNDYTTHPINGQNDFLYCTKARAASEAIRNVTDRIIKHDPQAKELLVEIWEKACEEGGLKNLTEYMDQTYNLLLEAQELNFKRWPILNEKVHMNFQALGSYDAEVSYMRNCIVERFDRFDEYVRR